MLALIYIGGGTVIAVAIAVFLFAISKPLCGAWIAFLWWLAFFSDWRLPRLRRKRPRGRSDSQ